jgi:hypothetical protein
MGVGGRGKCPGAPSHHLKEGERIGKNKLEVKNGRPKRYRKSRMARNGKALKKKTFNLMVENGDCNFKSFRDIEKVSRSA